ncbi:MAG: hypothetical protein IT529_10100 [Burkholderiales bacterium]|nr:hypothetical protein [Burkholderiales bacterium]
MTIAKGNPTDALPAGSAARAPRRREAGVRPARAGRGAAASPPRSGDNVIPLPPARERGDTTGTMDRIEPIPGGHAAALTRLEDDLHALWRFGRNVILAWCRAETCVSLLAVPHYLPAEVISADAEGGAAGDERGRAVIELINGPKEVPAGRFALLARLLGLEPHRTELGRAGAIAPERIEDLVRRYSISRFEDRAVVLFDIVGFSLHDPLVQLTQLNSLAYSINAAHEQLRQRVPDVDIRRTTTGDGFYVWNRRSGVEANIHLYHLMHLVLADNAIARVKSRPGLVPAVKTAYHIGSHYEFFQDEALRPTHDSYIVGDVTIQLARVMHSARPGQVIVGDFNVLMPRAGGAEEGTVRMDAAAFIARLQGSLEMIRGIVLSGERVRSIKCYLTGPRGPDGRYRIQRQLVRDKHGLSHAAFNAKINIFRENGPPIFLGLPQSALGMRQ